jgi:hypothetical protein
MLRLLKGGNWNPPRLLRSQILEPWLDRRKVSFLIRFKELQYDLPASNGRHVHPISEPICLLVKKARAAFGAASGG